MTKTRLSRRGFEKFSVLVALIMIGGSGKTSNILKLVEERELLPKSYFENPNWKNALCWGRKDLVISGKLAANSKRGVWELSDGFATEFYNLVNEG